MLLVKKTNAQEEEEIIDVDEKCVIKKQTPEAKTHNNLKTN